MDSFNGLPVKIQYSQRRTVSLQVITGLNQKVCLLIRAPYHIDNDQLDMILHAKRSWIEQAKIKLTMRQQDQKGLLSDYAIKESGFLPFRGKTLEVKLILQKSIPKLMVEMDDQQIRILRNPNFHGYQEELPLLLKTVYIKKAYELFSQIIQEYINQYGFKVNSLRIKDTKTRWGSCSARMNINLNWKLIIANHRVYEYVIVHELSHLGCWNHSSQFWNRVSSIMPDYQDRKTELKKISTFLSSFEFTNLEMNL